MPISSVSVKGTGCGSFKPSATYPSLRGAMTWSISWDASNGYAFANTVGGSLDGFAVDLAFAVFVLAQAWPRRSILDARIDPGRVVALK